MISFRKRKAGEVRVYLGVDVGGTKIQASLIEESGAVRGRQKISTPRNVDPEQVVAEIEVAMKTVLKDAGLEFGDLTAIGIAIPGVVDPAAGRVVVTPNMNLGGLAIGAILSERFKTPVALGNDCNLGALGEAWLGSARNAKSMMSILVGTGIGGGFVRNGKLWRGAREAAGEIGHIIMQMGGPRCGCGNSGCFEALASRTAIERDLRAGIAAGRETVLTEILKGDLSVIRSGALREALAAGDTLVTEVMQRAAEILGHACLTVRHLIDPEVIVLGGGVIGACSGLVMPIVERIIDNDQLPGARDGGHVLLSALGDDAVVLGAVALACTQVGRNPFQKQYAVRPEYPQVVWRRFGEITVEEKGYDRDVYLLVDGRVKKRKSSVAMLPDGDSHTVGPEELEKICKGGPEILFIGTGESNQLSLNDDGRQFLRQRLIDCESLPTPAAIDAYNKSTRRKAALLHVTC
ncbi:MAG: ROK family protein [Rhodopirellula sp.]|nr:ROK family protein [Rhodopirellula sp.]